MQLETFLTAFFNKIDEKIQLYHRRFPNHFRMFVRNYS